MPVFPAIGMWVLGALGTAGPATLGTATAVGIGTTVAAGAAGTAAGMALSADAKAKTQAKNVASDIAGAQRRATEEQTRAIEAQTLAAKEAPGKAADAAKAALERRRRIQMLSGGQTLLAGETVSDTKGKSLLGS